MCVIKVETIKKNQEGECNTNYNLCNWNESQRIGKETGLIGKQKKNLDHQSHHSVKIGSLKSVGYLKTVTIT